MFLGPWSEMHRLNLGWFIAEWNKFYAEWQSTLQAITGALTGEIERVEAAMTDLYAARDAAAASATSANSSALNASASSLAAMDARDAAVSAKNTAQSAASSATASETAAGNSATLASNKATQAGNSATAAAQSAGAAQQSETDAATEALKSEGYAVGKQNGTDVASGSPYYHNNSKYYADSVAADAVAAAASASAAAESATEAATSAAGIDNNTLSAIAECMPSALMPYKNLSTYQKTAGGSKITVNKNIVEIERLSGTSTNNAYDLITGNAISTTPTDANMEAYGVECPDNIYYEATTLESNSNSSSNAMRVYYYNANDNLTYTEISEIGRPKYYKKRGIISSSGRSATNKKILIAIFRVGNITEGAKAKVAVTVDSTTATTVNDYYRNARTEEREIEPIEETRE